MYRQEALDEIARAYEAYEAAVRQFLELYPSSAPAALETMSGLPLKNLYTPLDVAGGDYLRDLGFPGQCPCTRGVHPTGYLTKEWTLRQVVGLGTAEETNERLRYLFSQGQTGFSVCGMGYQSYDSDDERALGFVGRGGVWIDTLADIETLFEGIDMEAITVNQIGGSIPVFAMILATARRRGIDISKLRGTIQNTILAVEGDLEGQGKGCIDIIEFCVRDMPRWNHTSISVRNVRDAGCIAPQEIAFALWEGVTTARAAMARGIGIDKFAPRVSFFLSAENDFLEEVAKFRALRRMWARLMRDRFGARDPRSLLMRFHVQTSAINLTAQQPLNNLIRSTIHALAAVLGGALSLSVNSFDEVLATPTEASATLSLRTQQIIWHESGVAKVLDPLGGSYCIEALTDQLEKEAAAILERMEAMSVDEARSFIMRTTEEEAYRRQRRIDAGEQVVVGVNRFVMEGEEELPLQPAEIQEYDPTWQEKQVARLRRVRWERDSQRAEAARRRLAEAYRARENIIPAMIEAVEAYLSIGEIARTREEALGEPPFRGPFYFGR
jgi:methylmalonyl-CoA mutase N-terminal domain/subunit